MTIDLLADPPFGAILRHHFATVNAMPITLTCACGKTLRVADEHAGRRVKCPACNAITTASAPQPAPKPEPEADPVFEVVESAPRPAPPIYKPRVEDEEFDGTTYGLAGSGGKAGEVAEDDGPRDKPLPDFRLGSGQRGKKRRKNR